MVCIVCDDEALQLILANRSRWKADGPTPRQIVRIEEEKKTEGVDNTKKVEHHAE